MSDVEARFDPDDGVYYVERVLGKREVNGTKQYLIKWWGYPQSENTWEPESNCNCPDFIAAYEELIKVKIPEPENLSSTETNDEDEDEKQYRQYSAFDRGLEPSEILGATDSYGELMFRMKWKDSNYTDLVPAKQANIRCPQIVIRFYERSVSWPSSSEVEKKSKETAEAD